MLYYPDCLQPVQEPASVMAWMTYTWEDTTHVRILGYQRDLRCHQGNILVVSEYFNKYCKCLLQHKHSVERLSCCV